MSAGAFLLIFIHPIHTLFLYFIHTVCIKNS